ncbi:MAG: hypothetical protein ACJ786_31465 [Catenulispora sp.]
MTLLALGTMLAFSGFAAPAISPSGARVTRANDWPTGVVTRHNDWPTGVVSQHGDRPARGTSRHNDWPTG